MGYKYRGTIHDLEPVEPAPAPKAKPKKPRTGLFDPAKCGTHAGYKQHARHNTVACGPCKAANSAYGREYAARRKLGPIVKGFNPSRCGTYAGYARHRRSDVPACMPCRVAHADYINGYRAARKAAA